MSLLRWSAVACAIIAVLAGAWLYYKDIAPSPTISQKPVITQNEVKKVAEKSEEDKKVTMREKIESPTLLAHKEQQPVMKHRKRQSTLPRMRFKHQPPMKSAPPNCSKR